MSSEIKINNINFYGISSLDTYDDKCGICREVVYSNCVKCQLVQNNKDNVEKCYGVIGVCNHSYHRCCIDNWIKSANYVSRNCPTCNQKWEMKKRPITIK